MSDNEKIVSLSGVRDKDKATKVAKKEEKNDAVGAVVCTFCGRPNHLVPKIIKGPGVNICSECTMICVQYLIMEDKMPTSEAQKVLDTFWQGAKK